MKLYFVESGTASNYIMAETSRGILCNNCTPDGCWAGISLYGYNDEGERIDYEALAKKLFEATDPDLCESDLYWMGEPCCSSLAEWDAGNDAQEPFNRDERYLIGEFGDV